MVHLVNMHKERFKALYPDVIYLELENNSSLKNYLLEKNWILENEQIKSVEKPGEGNMNFVMRVITDQKSFILKQSRPWVQKYSTIDAPIDRVNIEGAFYNAIASHHYISSQMPKIIGWDKDQYIIAFEDLGASSDFTFCYRHENTIEQKDLRSLIDFLEHLHQIQVADFPDNLEMRKLNHFHIFQFPFLANNGFDLDQILTGLQSISLKYKSNERLNHRLQELGNIYLSGDGHVLLHGDYYPGSWIQSQGNTKIIDPEFSFLGKAEFDLGVFKAHLILSGIDSDIIYNILGRLTYAYEPKLMDAFAGTEILRRLIGVAQLPLPHSLQERELLLERAYDLI